MSRPSFCGLSRHRPGEWVAELAPCWVARCGSGRHERREVDRRREAGAGPKYELVFTDRLLVTLVHSRTGLTEADRQWSPVRSGPESDIARHEGNPSFPWSLPEQGGCEVECAPVGDGGLVRRSPPARPAIRRTAHDCIRLTSLQTRPTTPPSRPSARARPAPRASDHAHVRRRPSARPQRTPRPTPCCNCSHAKADWSHRTPFLPRSWFSRHLLEGPQGVAWRQGLSTQDAVLLPALAHRPPLAEEPAAVAYLNARNDLFSRKGDLLLRNGHTSGTTLPLHAASNKALGTGIEPIRTPLTPLSQPVIPAPRSRSCASTARPPSRRHRFSS